MSDNRRVEKKSRMEPKQKRLLIFDVASCLLAFAYSVLVAVELHNTFGQCVVGMALNEGGILIEGVRNYICRCPLYSVMLASAFSWISIMANVVSDLKAKKFDFAHWTKYQFIMSLLGFALNVVNACLTSYGVVTWCSRLVDSDSWSSYYPESRYSVPDNSTCFNAAKSFDKEFNLKDEQFIQQKTVFYYAFSVLALQVVITVWHVLIVVTSAQIWKEHERILKLNRATKYNAYMPPASSSNDVTTPQSEGAVTHRDVPASNSDVPALSRDITSDVIPAADLEVEAEVSDAEDDVTAADDVTLILRKNHERR